MSSSDNTDIAKNRLIVALDVPNMKEGAALLDRLEGQVGVVKVGLELFTACGPGAVEEVVKRGYGVFLDLKLHDIPNTVAGAVRAAKSLGISMLTLHAGGGENMLAAAHQEAGDDILLLAVTLLTSLGAEDLAAVSIEGDPREVVTRRAAVARKAGVRGVVCSPKEIRYVRDVLGSKGIVVTPGIRPAGAAMGDQKRAATPESAIADGASYLVVGRPITGSSDPAGAAASIVQAIAKSMRSQ